MLITRVYYIYNLRTLAQHPDRQVKNHVEATTQEVRKGAREDGDCSGGWTWRRSGPGVNEVMKEKATSLPGG